MFGRVQYAIMSSCGSSEVVCYDPTGNSICSNGLRGSSSVVSCDRAESKEAAVRDSLYNKQNPSLTDLRCKAL